MWTSLKVFALGFVFTSVACSSGTKSTNGSGASANAGGTAGNATGSGGSANGTGSGGSANGTGNGGNANGGSTQSGNGGSANGTGSSFCLVGYQGCVCDAGSKCASGLTCTNGTCCDTKSGSCSPLPPTGGTGVCSGNGGGGPTGAAGSSGAGTCTPGTAGPVLTDCGYPYASSNPLTSVTFSESEVLRGIEPSGGAPLASIRLFYNDEHALTLGVRNVAVKATSGNTSTDYPVTPLANDPDHSGYPQTGTNQVSGDQSGLDPSGRPMWPALFITDTTANPNDRSGDWQQCGRPYNPNVIFGTWKAAVRTVDTTVSPNTMSITPDADPAKNNWNLGGGDPVPSTLITNQGYGAEVRWDLVLVPGHTYRIQVMVHDGDQNKAGGDSGEACVDFCAGASCPDGSATCDSDAACPAGVGAVCLAGCCILPG